MRALNRFLTDDPDNLEREPTEDNEPQGWIRHVPTNRRRTDGTKDTEYQRD